MNSKMKVTVRFTDGSDRVFSDVVDITQPANNNGVVYLDYSPKSYVMLPVNNIIAMGVKENDVL